MKKCWLKRKNKPLKRFWIKRKPPKKRKKVIDKKSITYLHKKARAVFAKFIVLRDKHICFTCEKYGDQAGHFEHGKSMDFSEKGNNCQCVACNYFRDGNLIVYAIKLEKKYGYGIIQKLKREKDKGKIWRTKELKHIIIHYEKIITKLTRY